MPSRIRVNAFLARRGVASRRRADELIAAGLVEVNGAVTSLGALVDPQTDRVTVAGAPVGFAHATQVLALNKPRGVISTVLDERHRRTVMDLVPALEGLVPVGRLDADTHGLLLLTSDGELAHRLTHPRYGVRKRYQATVTPPLESPELKRLIEGVELEDGPARALSATVLRRVSGGQVIELEMVEGRKREVRRLFRALGAEVVDLTRTRVGPIALAGLPEGRWRELAGDELQLLYAAAGLPPPSGVGMP